MSIAPIPGLGMLQVASVVWAFRYHLLIFGLALAYFVWLTAPDITWVNVDADGVIYLRAAKYWTLAHPTGAPAYNILNGIALRVIPFGSEFQRLALLSAASAAATCTVLYASTRQWLPPLIYAAAGVVVSQATILDAYALITLCMVLMYHYRDRPYTVALIGAVGIGIHHLIGFSLLPIIAWHLLNKRSVKPFALAALGALWYLYVPIVNHAPFIAIRGDGFSDYMAYFFSQGRLIMGLAVMSKDAVMRLQDAPIIILGAFLAAIVPLAMGMWGSHRNTLLFWLTLLPIIHYVTAMPALQLTYLLPAVAFGAIIASDKLDVDLWQLKPVVAGVALTAVGFNLFMYDIGRQIDPEQTAMQYIAQLDAIEPDAVIWTKNRGWEKMTAILHNQDAGLNIETLNNPDEQTAWDLITQAEIDGRLYRTQVVNPAAYQVVITPTTRAQIWDEVLEQIYWPVPPAEAREQAREEGSEDGTKTTKAQE